MCFYVNNPILYHIDDKMYHRIWKIIRNQTKPTQVAGTGLPICVQSYAAITLNTPAHRQLAEQKQ